jgi:hypothetical protein
MNLMKKKMKKGKLIYQKRKLNSKIMIWDKKKIVKKNNQK